MDKREIKELVDRYVSGKCSEEERAYVETWYNRADDNFASDFSDEELESDLKEMYGHLPQKQFSPKRFVWIRYAAILVAVISLGLWFTLTDFNHSEKNKNQATVQLKDNDFSPGGNKATLTLADGTQIILDDVSSGTIAHEAGNAIYKGAGGQIIYQGQNRKTDFSGNSKSNTITTPRGGQYTVILSDGTKVWLNAASSLIYPTVFDGPERVVQLVGEGYFEVANRKEPFKVITSKQIVEVLGTHFNVNSYDDEPFTQTTLLEGSVKVVAKLDHQSVLLKPGEQSSLGNNRNFNILTINVNDAVAWKSGLFRFHNADVSTVMRQFSRWYDVPIEFEGKVPGFKLWGEVYRNVNATQALEILTYFNLKYRIEENNGLKKIVIFEAK